MVTKMTLASASGIVEAHAVNELGECGICGESWPCRAHRISYGLLVIARENDALYSVNEDLIRQQTEWRHDAVTLDAAGTTITRVRALHTPVPFRDGVNTGLFRCENCQAPNVWPCETARIVYTEEEIAAELAGNGESSFD